MPVTSISLNNEQKKLLKKLAKKEGKTQSDILQEALRQYNLAQQWTRIRKIGRATALKYGLQTEDDIERFLG